MERSQSDAWFWLATWPETVVAQPRAARNQRLYRRVPLSALFQQMPAWHKLLAAHGLEHMDITSHSSCILGLIRAKPAFTYDPLQNLDKLQSLQRTFWSLLSAGMTNAGHLHFLEVLEVMPIEPLAWPSGHTRKSQFVSLAGWLRDALADALVQSRGSLPACLEAEGPLDYCLFLPAPFCLLTMYSHSRSLSVCELGKVRLDLPETLVSIGWHGRQA